MRICDFHEPFKFFYTASVMVDCKKDPKRCKVSNKPVTFMSARGPVTIMRHKVPKQVTRATKMKRCQKLGHPAMIERCQHAVRTGIVE